MPDLGPRPSVSGLARVKWDLVVVGGGITGAGILREAARLGLRAVLVERGDFAGGCSSRSSKLVHGGLQYLARLELGLARVASRERNRLVAAGGDLVRPLEFILPVRRRDHSSRWKLRAALGVYGLLAGESVRPRSLVRDVLDRDLPGLHPAVRKAFVYHDAVTDDAGLVLRVLREACELGACAVNYVEAVHPVRGSEGHVMGISVMDRCSGAHATLAAHAVVNATGAWADTLRSRLGLRPRVRWIRGSHVVLRSGVSGRHAVVTLHPESGHPVYLIPWAGRTLVGSTHVEERTPAGRGERITFREFDYLVRGLRHLFPTRSIRSDDVVSTFTGVRPIVDWGEEDPACASRDHAIWEENGLVTVTGGKLTTFQSMAFDVMERLRRRFPFLKRPARLLPPLVPSETLPRGLAMDRKRARRLLDRYGMDAVLALAEGTEVDREPVGSLPVLRGELRWIARNEAVVHLDDLLLRRVRIGLTAPEGGLEEIEELRRVLQPALGWDDVRWKEESIAYHRLWRRAHARPPGMTKAGRDRGRYQGNGSRLLFG